MRNGKTAYNVYLSGDDRAHLEDLSERLQQPASQVVRTALNHYYKMAILGIPTCATGMPCFWPQQHPQPIRLIDIPSQVTIPLTPAPAPTNVTENKNRNGAA
jgi:hypothetical protein